MKLFNIATLLIGLGLCFSGCAASYTSFYYTSQRGRGVASVSLARLDGIISEAIMPFGFRKETTIFTGSDMVVYFKMKNIFLSNDLEILEGSGATISISMSKNDPQICIRDFDNLVETDFMKRLKGTVSQRLKNEGVSSSIRISHF